MGLLRRRGQPEVDGSLANTASGKCLDVRDNTADGAKLQLWTCTGGANQRRNVLARRSGIMSAEQGKTSVG